MRQKFAFMFMMALLLLGCQPQAEEEPGVNLDTTAVEPEPNIMIPEPTRATEAQAPIEGMVNEATAEALPPPIVITAEETEAAAPVDITPVVIENEPEPTLYKVIDVASNDVLNVRGGPGVDNPITGALAHDATRVQVTGEGELVGSSRWVPIVTTDTVGWVNSVYLAEMSSAEVFCSNAEAAGLLEQVLTAVEEQNGELLAAIAHPDGISIGMSWWNPQINIAQDELKTLFTTSESIVWGTQAGSGNEIKGSFAEAVLPVLQEDMLAATEKRCHTLLAGPTAGIVQLPEGYEETNFYAIHRPAPEEGIEFDWGTWVVGFAKENGRYYVRYLMHIEYEI